MKARGVPHNLNQTQNDYQPNYIVFNHNRYVGLLQLENTMQFTQESPVGYKTYRQPLKVRL